MTLSTGKRGAGSGGGQDMRNDPRKDCRQVDQI